MGAHRSGGQRRTHPYCGSSDLGKAGNRRLDLEQIKFLLGHSSIQTTERYLGSEQEIAAAVNDNLGL